MITEKAISIRQVGFALTDRFDLCARELDPGDEFLQELKQVRGFLVPYLYPLVDHNAQKYGFNANP